MDVARLTLRALSKGEGAVIPPRPREWWPQTLLAVCNEYKALVFCALFLLDGCWPLVAGVAAAGVKWQELTAMSPASYLRGTWMMDD